MTLVGHYAQHCARLDPRALELLAAAERERCLFVALAASELRVRRLEDALDLLRRVMRDERVRLLTLLEAKE